MGMNDENKYEAITIRKEMAGVVAAYQQSGRSLKEFARERGIRPGLLHYWVYQKNRKAKPVSLAQKPQAGRRTVFQEIKLEAGSTWLPSWAAEVSLSRGLNIRFSGTASPDWISGVIQALQRPC